MARRPAIALAAAVGAVAGRVYKVTVEGDMMKIEPYASANGQRPSIRVSTSSQFAVTRREDRDRVVLTDHAS